MPRPCPLSVFQLRAAEGLVSGFVFPVKESHLLGNSKCSQYERFLGLSARNDGEGRGDSWARYQDFGFRKERLIQKAGMGLEGRQFITRESRQMVETDRQ